MGSSKGRGRSLLPAGTKEKGGGSGNKSTRRSFSPSHSPTRHSRTRGARRSRTRRREGVVERVVREMSGSSNWPQLMKTNYDTWSLLMKLKMQSCYLWDAIEGEDVDFHDDRSALEAICSGMPQEMVPTLATKASAKEAWESIRTITTTEFNCRGGCASRPSQGVPTEGASVGAVS